MGYKDKDGKQIAKSKKLQGIEKESGDTETFGRGSKTVLMNVVAWADRRQSEKFGSPEAKSKYIMSASRVGATPDIVLEGIHS